MAEKARNYGLITSPEQLGRFVDRLIADGRAIGFDIETGYAGDDREAAALHPEEGFVVGISFTNSTDWARYVPLRHELSENMDEREAARQFWRMLESGLGVAHNAKFERRFLSKWFRDTLWDDPEAGERVRASNGYFPVRSDTILEAYLDASQRRFGLKALTKALFGHDQAEFASLFPAVAKSKQKTLRFNTLELTPAVVAYACEDAAWCLALHEHFYPKVKDRLLYRVEMQVMAILCEMEDFGILYDWAAMASAHARAQDFLNRQNEEIQRELSELVGTPVSINLGSPKQLSDILYGVLGMKTTRKSKATGAMSTDAIAMAGLANEYPVVRKILEWKEMRTLVTRYLEKYQREFNYAPDGMAHPNHMQTVVPTGRFAVSEPPYQQCLSGDTEILTPHGWKRLDALGENGAAVEVAQFIPEQGAVPSRQSAADRIEFVTGEMVNVPCPEGMIEIGPADQLKGSQTRKGEGGTWLYTPNHRIAYRPVRRAGLGALAVVEASEWEAELANARLSPRGRRICSRSIPTAGRRVGGRTLTPEERDELLVAIACQADGSLRTDVASGLWWFDVELYRERKRHRLSAVLGSGKPQSRGSERWRVAYSPEWLDETKNFRPEAVLALSAEDLEWFLDEVLFWDGDRARKASYGQAVRRRASVDVVQAAAVLAGLRTSIYERPKQGAVSVNLSTRQYRQSGWQQTRRVPSPDGRAYCVTVPSGFIVVRRNGVVQVTGNSPKKYAYELSDGTSFSLNFRDFLIAPPEHYILGFDYSQIELRMMAGESGEPTLLKAFNEDEDVHTATAALMLGIPKSSVDPDKRAIGKTLNFALLYGMGAKSLAERLAISKDEAQSLYNQYFEAYSAISVWVDRVTAEGKAQGYASTLFGRHCTIWEFLDSDPYIRSKGERLCVNAPIQGAAADYMKIAMVRADEALARAGLKDRVRLVMNIHDALEFYVHESLTPEEVIAVLRPAVEFSVPRLPKIVADWHTGSKWGQVSEISVADSGEITAKAARNAPESSPEAQEGPSKAPERPVEALGEPAGAPVGERPPDAPGGVSVVVALEDMPTAAQYKRWLELVAQRPGRNTLILRTPEGDVVHDGEGSSLGIHNRSEIGMIFGRVSVVLDEGSVDLDAMADGLL